MVKNCCIAFAEDNDVKYIECSGDSEANKYMLMNYYTNSYKLKMLIALGNVLSLKENCLNSIFYCRDRRANYNDVKAKELIINSEYINNLLNNFNHVFLFQEGSWSYFSS